MNKVLIYADGACSGNPGPGGYGTIVKMDNTIKEYSGGELRTTNNRMELTGVIVGLSSLTEKSEVIVTTDSKYIVDSVTKGWVYKWKRNNWIKSDRKKALNIDLWEKMLKLLMMHEVTFVWVKGHNGHPENERCDELAVMERNKFGRD